MDRYVARATLALAFAVVGAAASASECRSVRVGTSYSMPDPDLVLACGDTECVVSYRSTTLATVSLGRNPTVCSATRKETEDPLPGSCPGRYGRATMAFARDLDEPGMRAEVVVDTFADRGRVADVPFSPAKSCVPKYREKRGDVWQKTWSGASRAFAFQVFEEDDAAPGRGNSSRRNAPVPVASVARARSPVETVTARPKGRTQASRAVLAPSANVAPPSAPESPVAVRRF